MMALLLVFTFAILQGNVLSEPGGGLGRDEYDNMDCDADIILLEKQMPAQSLKINQPQQQLSSLDHTKGGPERRLILGEMDYDTEIVDLKQKISQLVQEVSNLKQTKGNAVSEPGKRMLLEGNVEMDYDAEITLLKQQMAAQISENSQLRQKVSTLEQTKGATYVRWGRTTCDDRVGTSTVYSGYMAGTYSRLNTRGSGANYLCLAREPKWGHYTDKVDNDILITGVEYSFIPHHTSDITDFFGSNIFGNQAPCAVCHVDRGASIMIPGRTTCYGNWTAEYDGYLVTGYASYDDSTEYVCLDKRPDSVPGSGNFHAKNDLYFVEAKCGYDLECPPYSNGREIPCVVCSK